MRGRLEAAPLDANQTLADTDGRIFIVYEMARAISRGLSIALSETGTTRPVQAFRGGVARSPRRSSQTLEAAQLNIGF